MKTTYLFMYLHLMLSIWFCPVSAQKLIKNSVTYTLEEAGHKKRISVKEAKELIFSCPESKSLYEDAKSLEAITWVACGASLPFFLYYEISKIDFGLSALGGAKKEVNNTPLIGAAGLLMIGAATGITSLILHNKSVKAYNNRSAPGMPEDHTLRLTARPGSFSVNYEF